MTMFRKLNASEVEARVSTVTEKGCSILLYKDARVDQNILDETVGTMNWKRSHQLIGDRLYCTVEIWDAEKKQWISKQDVGTESYTEKEKGQASDSFKRACFNLGIGRELYTAPFIWIPAGNVNLIKKNDRYSTFDRFYVKSIGYDQSGNINQLTIVNAKGEAVYTFGKATEEDKKRMAEASTKLNKTQLAAMKTRLEKNNVDIDALLKMYGLEALEDMTISQMADINMKLEAKKEKSA